MAVHPQLGIDIDLIFLRFRQLIAENSRQVNQSQIKNARNKRKRKRKK
jgi:hypothetical protein